MRVTHLLFLLFLLVPLLEIYLLIQVGGFIGALPTVGAVVFTALLGAVLVKVQGLATVNRAQEALRQGAVPALEVFEGVLLLLAGALLLTPGFFTDALGFLALVPPLRRVLFVTLSKRVVVRHMGPGRGPGPGDGPRVIEGEYRRED
jgi:UPF0716 protein FxsA